MKIKIDRRIVFALLAYLGSIAGCSPQTGPEFIIEAVRSENPLTIDGFLNEEAWQRASPVVLRDNRSGQVVTNEQLTTRVRTCYDNTALYISFVCNDPDIWTNFVKRDSYLWTEEAVEVFIDVDDIPETYVEIEVSPANVLFDSYIVDPQEIDIPATAAFNMSRIKTAVNVQGTLNKRADTDSCWTVEMAVLFSDLASEKNKHVNPGTLIKINFYRLDKNQGAKPAGYAWSPTAGRFHKPSVFGRLIFN